MANFGAFFGFSLSFSCFLVVGTVVPHWVRARRGTNYRELAPALALSIIALDNLWIGESLENLA